MERVGTDMVGMEMVGTDRVGRGIERPGKVTPGAVIPGIEMAGTVGAEVVMEVEVVVAVARVVLDVVGMPVLQAQADEIREVTIGKVMPHAPTNSLCRKGISSTRPQMIGGLNRVIARTQVSVAAQVAVVARLLSMAKP